MTLRLCGKLCLLGVTSALVLLQYAAAQLNVTYGSAGVQTLSYSGVTLEDLSANAGDAFHIWHMKLTDMQGNVLSGPNYGWGENNTGKVWNSATNTWTYTFVWGTVSVQFVQSGSNLNMLVNETNSANSGVILDGASIYPFVLHFPQLPSGFINASYPQLAFNTTGPSVILADFSAGEVATVVPSAQKPLYSGFLPAAAANSYTPFVSSTTPDGLATFQPHNDRHVQPGQTDTFTVSLRFAPEGTSTSQLASDAYSSWAQTWPSQLDWTDRRPIGTAYLASSPAGSDDTHPGGYPNNPRRYFNDSNASDFDVTTTAGLAAFQAKILQQAVANVQNTRKLGGQGAITWDIEGEQYPQATSYVCEPDNIAQIAPEMESVISDHNSPYVGMKLDDAYFKIMTNAGLRVGVCIRPQHFTLNADGSAQQVYLPDSSIAAELTRKIQYAHNRWGATLFYIDSTVETDGAVLDAGIFQQVAASFPDSLLIPEETTPKYYAYTAPFLSYIFHGSLGTDPTVHAYYPNAFSAILINDADAGVLATNVAALTASVKAGDILMGHIDYWQANNPTIVSIYANAGVTSTPSAPVTPTPTPTPIPTPTPTPNPTPVTPTTTPLVSIVSPSAGATLSGSVVVQGSISTNLDAAGSYLMVDGLEIGTARITQSPFFYALNTTNLAAGNHTLQLWAHDQNNENLLSSAVLVTVVSTAVIPTPTPTPTPTPPPTPTPTPAPTPAPVQTAAGPVSILYPAAGQAISGIVEVSAVITAQLDAAGSYLMVDGVEYGTQRFTSAPYVFTLNSALLSSGQHTLQIWAHDTNNETLLSNVVTVIVN